MQKSAFLLGSSGSVINKWLLLPLLDNPIYHLQEKYCRYFMRLRLVRRQAEFLKTSSWPFQAESNTGQRLVTEFRIHEFGVSQTPKLFL